MTWHGFFPHPSSPPVAEAVSRQVVKAAEAQADAAQLQGEGIARQRRAIIDGLRWGFSVCFTWRMGSQDL